MCEVFLRVCACACGEAYGAGDDNLPKVKLNTNFNDSLINHLSTVARFDTRSV